MAGRWPACRCSGGSRNGESGASGGHGGASGSESGASEQVRRFGAVGSVRAGGGWAARGGKLESRRLRDGASLRGESGQSGGVGRAWGAWCGAAWYWGGGGSLTLGGSAA